MAGVPTSHHSSFHCLIPLLSASLPLVPMGWSACIIDNYEIFKTFFNANSSLEGLYFTQTLFSSAFVSLSSTQCNSEKSGSTAEVNF